MDFEAIAEQIIDNFEEDDLRSLLRSFLVKEMESFTPEQLREYLDFYEVETNDTDN